ncbi:Hpt domain-containing protein [Methylomonas sp. MgM2]
MKNEIDCPPESLPGIDIAGGLKRCLGKWPFYKRMLLLFYQQYQTYAETIQTSIEQQAYDEVRTLAHGIKGSAGNIGAIQLNQDAAALEQACVIGTGDDIIRQFQSFKHSLNEVLSSLATLT